MTSRGLQSFLIALAVFAAGCGDGGGSSTSTSEAVEPAASVDVVRDVSYSENEFRHILDVYLPASTEEPVPVILAIHGGAFRDLSKAFYRTLGRYYSEEGYAFVATNYRLAPDHGGYPVQVEDSFCALAWVHAHASEYGFDSDRVVVWGGSAGGYLASMVATANYPSIYLEDCPHEYPSGNALRAAVVFYGLFDFTNVDDFSQSDLESNLPVFWGATYEEMPVELLEEMSPILHVDETDPPFILIHGTADTQLPHVMSERFADALEEAGVDVELLLVPDVGHAFEQILTTSAMATTLDQLNGFLEHNLGIG